MRTTTTLRFGALALAGASFLAACGSGTPSSKVASIAGAGGPTTTAAGNTATSASKEDQQQALLDFAKCMRDHGIDMPDPQVNSDGGVTMQIKGSGDAPDKAKADAAQKDCQHFLDNAQGTMKTPTPQEQQEMQQKALDFAKCMRDHGINFPDPQFSSDGKISQAISGDTGADPNSPAFKSASDTCSKQVGMPSMGTGSATGKGSGGSGGSTGTQP